MKVLLLGTGQMARQYYLAVQRLGIDITVIGNSQQSVDVFNIELAAQARAGSINANKKILEQQQFDLCFIAVNENKIQECLKQLMPFSIKNYIVEKPGAISFADLDSITNNIVHKSTSQYYIAYNRRFYQSVKKLKELAKEDGGIISAQFEFSELSDRILAFNFPKERTENWFFLNSTHVIDLAFHLIGAPKLMNAMNFGPKSWHGNGDFFAGFGESIQGIPFSYSANWNAPGRWAVEVLTKEYRYYLKPLEGLERQKRNQFINEKVPLEKPEGIKEGIIEIVEAAVSNQFENFLSFEDQMKKIPLYKVMMEGGIIS